VYCPDKPHISILRKKEYTVKPGYKADGYKAEPGCKAGPVLDGFRPFFVRLNFRVPKAGFGWQKPGYKAGPSAGLRPFSVRLSSILT
jgi:hypothetical protein